MKKVKKQSLLHLVAFITIGMGLAGLVHQNSLSAAQPDDRSSTVRLKIKSWFGGVNKRLATIMSEIINRLKNMKKKVDSNMKKMDSNMKQMDSKMKEMDFDMKKMDSKLKFRGLK